MAEVVVSSENVEAETKSETQRMEEDTNSGTEAKTNKDGVVKWDKFLPRMALRVLLVEADDSTRQIISALLRKCSYRVAAVPDGLKAWEILKGRPHNIDLILTEVDLPSISGYALLTLIMEHEICKNIPVIMMSSQDSIGTVYKCMLRGAADYLVKPIRRNELRILWQHVWRRQSSIVGGTGPHDESVGQQKLEATSENDAASNRSSGFQDCLQRSKEKNEKGSDAQSSCTKPDLDTEGGDMENMQDFQLLKWGKSLLNNINVRKHEECVGFYQKLPMHESDAGGSALDTCKKANKAYRNEDVEPECQRGGDITGEAYNAPVSSSRKAIDFMGAFSTHNSSSNNVTSMFDSPASLDLSLRRSHLCGLENHVSEKRPMFWHCNASAFTKYTNKLKETQCSTSLVTSYEKNLSNVVTGFNSNAPGPPPNTHRSIPPVVIDRSDNQPKQSEVTTPWPQQRVFSGPVLVKGLRVSSLNKGYGSGATSILCRQSSPSPTPSPSSASQQELSSRANLFHQSSFGSNKCEQLCDQLGPNGSSVNQPTHKLDHRLDCLEDRGHNSPATDQSGTSSFYSGAMNRLNCMGYGSACGSNSHVDQVAVVRTVSECKNQDGLLTPIGNSQRSIQREAALTKFRLKRKDRCFEKKVRYESRKKLAEQRPRIKGQFVRQVHNEPAAPACASYYGNSSDG